MEILLPENRVSLDTQLAFGNNGTKWREDERMFTYDKSVKIVKTLKRRTAQDVIYLGLELMWAKAHLRHGEWLTFLEDVGVNRSASSRFMKYTKGYMVEKGLLIEGDKKVNKSQIAHSMNLLNSDVATLQQISTRGFWGMKPVGMLDIPAGAEKDKAINFDIPNTISKIRKQAPKWSNEERQGTIALLKLWVEMAQCMVTELEDFDQQENEQSLPLLALAQVM